MNIVHIMGFPGGASGKEHACQCRRLQRHGFNPQVGKIPWRRAWQPSPVFLPGESQAQRKLAGYSAQSCKESDTTEATYTQHIAYNIKNKVKFFRWRHRCNQLSLNILPGLEDYIFLREYFKIQYTLKEKLIINHYKFNLIS